MGPGGPLKGPRQPLIPFSPLALSKRPGHQPAGGTEPVPWPRMLLLLPPSRLLLLIASSVTSLWSLLCSQHQPLFLLK